MKKTPVEVNCYLAILGFDCAVEEMTRVIGVPPSETWQIGDLVAPNLQLKHKETGWILRPLSNDSLGDPNAAILDVLKQIPDLSVLHALPAGARGLINLGLTGITQRPSFILSPQTLEVLGRSSLTLGVDPYDLT